MDDNAKHAKSPIADTVDHYFNLGTYTRPISTSTTGTTREHVVTWVTRGLIWCYAFHHEEALVCFRRAIALDHDCCMAHWGVAFALGPNYNKPWSAFAEEERIIATRDAYDAAREAVRCSAVGGVEFTAVEKAIAKAVQARYPRREPPLPGEDAELIWNGWSQDYASAMRTAYTDFPTDLDVAALYADALMNLTPWKLWDVNTGLPVPGSHAKLAETVLSTALDSLPGAMSHPGLLHMYIHLMEMSPTPEVAMPAANALRELVPDAGHLQHMPSHIDILCGQWQAAMAANKLATYADDKMLALRGADQFYTLYRCHDLHFFIYAAMFAGCYAPAIHAVEMLEERLPESLLRGGIDHGFADAADWLEGFMAMRMHVYVRFGKWREILALSAPVDTELYCTTTAMRLYARGVALVAQGEVVQARLEQALFHEAAAKVPLSRTVFNNTCVDILAIAGVMLRAEIEFRDKSRGPVAAFQSFEKALHLEGKMPYDEPWGWMQPVRHAYGALLLEAGGEENVNKAASLYRADLGLNDTLPRAYRHLKNVWALHGLEECLRRQGQGSIEENRLVRAQLEEASKNADVTIKASCCCRSS